MILKTWKKQEIGKNGKKQYRDICIKKCDECGLEKEVHLDGVKISRLKRNSEIDLCRHCAGLIKHRGQGPRGKDNKNFKHGLHCSGYRLLTVADGIKCFEHRYFFEKYLGRALSKEERIHHIDLGKLNNDISNLFLCKNKKYHSIIHHQMENIGYQLLYKKVWFNYEAGTYELNNSSIITEEEESDLNVGRLSDVLNKKTGKYYRMYHYKNEDNEWRMRGYHVALVENKIGRKLFSNECVHHIDGDTLNNKLSNLVLMSKSKHISAHSALQKCVAELYKQGLVGFDKETGKYFVVEK